MKKGRVVLNFLRDILLVVLAFEKKTTNKEETKFRFEGYMISTV